MPKKFSGVNSKAEAAKAAKNEKAELEKQKKKKAEEDAAWEDNDKSRAKKQNRKEDSERKRLEALEKKKERQRLAEEEESSLGSGGKVKASPAPKITRSQIQQNKQPTAVKKKDPRLVAEEELPELEENLNRMVMEEASARNVEDAISVLGGKAEAADKHPEKRMKAAYEEFEKERLPQLKAENGNLRLSQLKQMLRKEWMKHPSNPFNQI